jgi:hypothetical protein
MFTHENQVILRVKICRPSATMAQQRHKGEETMPLKNEGRSMQVPGCCAVCGEPCEEKTITLSLPCAASGLAVIRNVPAEVCPICGEARFSLRTTGRLMAVVRSKQPPDEVAVVPIYDLDRSQ